MATQDLKEWYKFAFKLLVSDQWHVIADRVENGDQTYRWVKEQLILALRDIERQGWQKQLGSAAFNIKQRLELFKNPVINQEEYVKAQHWLKAPGGKFVLQDTSCSVAHRVLGAKLGLLVGILVNYDKPSAAGREVCDVFEKITDIGDVVNAIYENSDAKLAYEVKIMYDLAKEYAQNNSIPLDNLIELEFQQACLPQEAPPVFIPPETWVFGDYGYEDGQLSTPEKVQIDSEGNYLVMDQNITGDNVPQRIQLFSPKGKFLKVILRRGSGKVNGMRDFCLNRNGKIVVADTDDDDLARIQEFDYDGNQLMCINVDKGNPESCPRVLSVFIDDDDNILCADMGCACIWVYSKEGKVISRFGAWGRSEGNFIGLQSATSFNNKIYVFSNGIDCVKTQVFEYDGTYIKSIWPDYTYSQLIFDANGQVFAVTDDRIDKLDPDAKHQTVAGKEDSFGCSLEEFYNLSSMVMCSNGQVVVSERGNHRIKVFRL